MNLFYEWVQIKCNKWLYEWAMSGRNQWINKNRYEINIVKKWGNGMNESMTRWMNGWIKNNRIKNVWMNEYANKSLY